MKRCIRCPVSLLALGALLLCASQLRFGLGVLAWVAPIPWLRYLRTTRGWRSVLAFSAVAWAAWVLSTLKIVTAPVPAAIALGFGTGIALALALPFLGAALIRRRLGEDAGTLSFACLMVVAEWALHACSPLGVWGAAANTQLDQLALLQLASVTGLHGVSFLIYLVASVLERALANERRSLRAAASMTAALVVGAVCFGQVRLATSSGAAHPTRLVAAVGTDSEIGASAALPTAAELHEVERGLVARTSRAAAAGAELVVWTEAATLVYPADEEAWQQRLSELARTLRINLVASYIVALRTSPLRFENKYVFLRPDGAVDHLYHKHRPVPGEPAVRGEEPMPRAILADGSSVGGAICYDYDFPRVALANARLGVDLVALPSSDWRGIDPLHTQMAALRAIEGGHSVLRSTRFGLSAGIDPWGRLRGWDSAWDSERRVLLVELPRRGIQTIYARFGDWWPLGCALASIALGLLAMRRRRR